MHGKLTKTFIGTCFSLSIIALAVPAQAEMVLKASKSATAIAVDGNAAEWSGIDAITVPMSGRGGVDKVEIKSAIHGDMFYMLAVWNDPTKEDKHKPYKWDDASQSYKRTKMKEDRFAVSLAMSGNFSHDKLKGVDFSADVWHWKAGRTNPLGIAQDKRWVISSTKIKKANKFKTRDGKKIYIGRYTDAGDKLYKATTYDVKQAETMSRYKFTKNPQGSVADVKAKGVWKDGKWTLELSRKLDTGH